ncbi:MAG: MFS transporter [Desulfobacteraceae bacterium]|nr:MFS transporter [Desulfobacteraceae bacterium]
MKPASFLHPPPQSPPSKWMVLAAVATGAFLASLDGSIVNIALPTLVKCLRTEFAYVQWVVLAYLVTVVSLILPLGRLGDTLGKKTIYGWGFVIFTLGSALCGQATTLTGLVGFRVIQGTGASMIMALGFAIVTEAFPAKERGRAIGILSALCGIAIALGPVIGGFLIERFSWQWIFRVNLPIGIAGCLMVYRHVPATPCPTKETVDIRTAMALAIALATLPAGVTWVQKQGAANLPALGLGTACLASTLLFARLEKRAKAPLIDLTLFSDRQFAVNLATGVISFVAYAGVIVLLPFFLEAVAGFSTGKAGLLMTTIPLMLGLVSPVSGLAADRFGSRPVTLAGLCLFVLAYASAAFLDSRTPMQGIVWRLGLLGCAMGLFMSPNNSAIMGAVPPGRLGIASGMLTMARTLGQTLGVSMVGAFWALSTSLHSGRGVGASPTRAATAAKLAGFHDTFLLLSFLILLGLGGVLLAARESVVGLQTPDTGLTKR